MAGYTPFPPDQWDPVFAAFLDAETRFVVQDWSRLVGLPPPPADDPAQCAAVALRAVDLAARRADIDAEDAGLEGALWPVIQALGLSNVTGKNWTDALPCTWGVLLPAIFDLRPGLFQLKKKFNRGRPIHVPCAQVTPALKTPGHPAYPGGHAAQAQVAYLLLKDGIGVKSSFWPSLQAAAVRVADNRVVAGIHFPSDSDGGMRLADQFVPMLLRNAAFQALCAAARAELGPFGVV